MNNSLFPQIKIRSDFVFKILYEGSSFDGKMALEDLVNELTGFSDCLNTIISHAHKENILDINPLEYEFIVETFQKGSFKKIIRLLPKKLEKYPVTTNAALTVALILTGIGQIIATTHSLPTNEITTSSIDKIKSELLTDKEFLKSFSKIVEPLNKHGDSLKFINGDDSEYEINYSQKEKFEKFSEDDYEFITEKEEVLTGRITRVDLTATKNSLGFKINDTGMTIPCSFLDEITTEETKDLLDQWIQIKGVTEKNGKIRKHITIYEYILINNPHKTTELPFVE